MEKSGSIHLYRDLLTEVELDETRKILMEPRWGFGFISNDKTKPIWNFDKNNSRRIAEIISSHFTDYVLDDYHVNGQTLGQTAAPHMDSADGATHALVYFPFPWKYTWGGRLHILENDKPNCITPESNLAVFFDADNLHYAEGPTENVLRISIGLKLKVK